MRIVLTMVGITLGLAIAVVAAVYGWQQYSTAPVPLVASTPPAAPAEPSAPELSSPPTPKPKPTDSTPPLPSPATPTAPPVKPPMPTPTASAPATPSLTPKPPSRPPTPPATSPVPSPTTPGVAAEDQPIAVPETGAVVTAEKIDALDIGMTEEEVENVFDKEGVVTPASDLPAFTPEGWTEIRWANADGSYIAGLFNDQGELVNAQPFNLPGAFEWMARPHHAVPAWLNDRLQAANLPVRVPSVAVVESGPATFQFEGGLANVDGVFVGTVRGVYYTADPQGRFSRAIEGQYQYTLPNGAVDANTFQFAE